VRRSVKWWLLLAVALTSGCRTPGRPPLPKFATGEAPLKEPADDTWAATVRRADVIYFGLTRKSVADTQPSGRIVDTLQRGGARVALGWTEFPAAQQPLLDQWQRHEISRQQLLDQLGAPEHGDWLRYALRLDLVQVALGSPRELLRKVRAGDALTEEERACLPKNYRLRPDAFDNFVDRVSASPRLRRYNMAHIYRAHLAAEQMIAENIVRFMHDNPTVKLLVFLPDDAMINPREVADYVAQKASLQQMILDRSQALPGERSPLLACRRDGPIEVVNCAPGALRNDGRLLAPRLRT
jgi:Haem-binding uptake, Tiki superfamily, ChaN